MDGIYNEYLNMKNKERELEEVFVRDTALSTIPGILVPGPGTIISWILIYKSYKKFEAGIDNM